ncbi:nucleoside phosphorylase domain-containing protein [Aspergillus heterothallicus]
MSSEMDYLAVRVEDTASIMRKKGNSYGSMWRVTDDIYWHTPDMIFGKWRRSLHESECSCNYAQLLVSREEARTSLGRIISPTRLEPEGAVIFDGSPICGQESPRVRLRSGGSYSPVDDSGISVGYSPGPISDSGGSSTAKGKRPIRAESQFDNRCPPEDSGMSAEISQSAGSSGDQVFPLAQSRPRTGSQAASAHPSATTCRSQSHIAPVLLPDNSNDSNYPFSDEGASTVNTNEHTVGWICALQVELDAARKMLDHIHAVGFGHGMDCNLYTLGQIRRRKVVLTCLPMGQYGSNMAAVVATRTMNRFPNVDIGLLVGIGGGLPCPRNDIRLGDVVVSIPHLQYGGVTQYDMGKHISSGFIATGCLKPPPERLLQVLNYMPSHGSPMIGELHVKYPDDELDHLYETAYTHVGGDTCEACDSNLIVQRSILRHRTAPHVFYGTIASASSVIEDLKIPETLMKKHGVICCEMEAAGLMNTRFPCLVIRGISDYADSHKNNSWIAYAATAAAQYARDMLFAMPADGWSLV